MFVHQTVNKFFFALSFCYLFLRNIFTCRKGDRLSGGKLFPRNEVFGSILSNKMNFCSENEIDVSNNGNLLFQNGYSFASGMTDMWANGNLKIERNFVKQAFDGKLTRRRC